MSQARSNSESELLGTGNSDDAPWTELRVTVAPDLQDRLLVDVLAPFIRSEDKLRRRVFFVRDRSDSTSRLRIWLGRGASGAANELAGALRTSAGQSGSSCEVDVLRPVSIEGLLGPYGGPKATALLSNFLVDACELTLNQVVETVGRGRRMGIALDIMVSHLHAVDIARIFPDRYPNATPMPGCPATFPVYRANVDGFFVMSVDPAAAREQVNAQYERERASIHRRVAAVLSQFAGGPIVSEVGMLWHKIASEHLLRADVEVAIDALTVMWDKGYIGDNFDLTISPFHQVVQGSPPLRLYYKDDQGYLATRFMVSSMYLAVSSLGIRLIDRYILCHSIVRACEELFDVNATSAVQHMANAVEMKSPAGRS